MSNLTKEQLKNVLINHGVSTPPSSAKKEEYIKLYDEYVAPVISNKGEFSSDDEPDTSNVADSGLIRNIIQVYSFCLFTLITRLGCVPTLV